MTDAHVLKEQLTRREIGIVVAWVRSGFALDGGAEERQPYALRILAKLRAAWLAAPADDGPGDDTPLSYSVPPSQSPEINRATAELWGGMDPAGTIADHDWREYAGALAACDTALRMGARHAAVVGGRDEGCTFVVKILAADEIGCNWQEVWRPPERKVGSASRWDGNSGKSRGGSRRSK